MGILTESRKIAEKASTPFERCHRCVFYDVNSYSGISTCTRSYPARSDFRTDCKIRWYPKAPLIDAFREKPQHKIDFDRLFGKDIVPMSDATLDEKKKKAAAFLKKYTKNVEEKKGSSIVVGFGDELPEQYQGFKRLRLGIPSLDRFFGGGLPMGGLISAAGAESSGKTTFALRIAAAVQRTGGLVAYADAENTLDLTWARTQGVDTGDLIVMSSGLPKGADFTSTTLEDYLNGVIQLINGGYVDLVVLDSLDAMMARGRVKAKKGKERDLDDSDIALKARVLSDFYPRILGSCRENGTTLFQIGQLRATGIGGPFVTNQMSGGMARKFYDLLTLTLRRGEKSSWPKGDSSEDIGYTFVLTAKKSKVGGVRENATMQTAFFYEQGFDREYEIVKWALEEEVILKKKGAAQAFFTPCGADTPLKIPFGKEFKISQWVKQNDLYYEILCQLTGEEIPLEYTWPEIQKRQAEEIADVPDSGDIDSE